MIKKIMIFVTVFFTAQSAAFAAGDINAGPGGFGDHPPRPHHEGGESKHGHHGGGGGEHRGPQDRAVFDACATELGISKPAQGVKPSDADRQKMMSCVKAKMEANRAVMDACLKAAGVGFGENGRPTARPSKDVFETCRAQVESGSAAASATATDTSTSSSSAL